MGLARLEIYRLMGYTTPFTAVAGFGIPAANWNSQIRDSIEAVAKPPMCKLIRTSAWAATLPNNAVTEVPFSSAKWDSAPAMFDVANPKRITFSVAARYEIKAAFYFSGAATGTYRGLQVNRFNSLGVNQNTPGLDYRPPGALSIVTLSCEEVVSAGDYITLSAQQDSGATQGLAAFNIEGYCYFSARLVSYL